MELTPDLHPRLCPPYPVLPWFSGSLNGMVTLPRDLRCCHQTGGATGPGAGTGLGASKCSSFRLCNIVAEFELAVVLVQ